MRAHGALRERLDAVAAVAMTAGMRVNELARVAVSFPTYAEILVHAAVLVASQLDLELSWEPHQRA